MRSETQALKEISFDTISGAGPNGAIVHYRVTTATNRKLKAGELYLVDSGAQYLDGTTDVTRTVAIGTPTREMCERFTLVLKGHIGIATARFPKGTRGIDLDPFARRALWEAGLDFDHGTGHGVGSYLSVHEGPQSISKGGMIALEPGMIISNEPGYYKTGGYGIRIENLVLVTEPAKVAARRARGDELRDADPGAHRPAAGGGGDAVTRGARLAQRLSRARGRGDRAGARPRGPALAGAGDGAGGVSGAGLATRATRCLPLPGLARARGSW